MVNGLFHVTYGVLAELLVLAMQSVMSSMAVASSSWYPTLTACGIRASSPQITIKGPRLSLSEEEEAVVEHWVPDDLGHVEHEDGFGLVLQLTDEFLCRSHSDHRERRHDGRLDRKPAEYQRPPLRKRPGRLLGARMVVVLPASSILR